MKKMIYILLLTVPLLFASCEREDAADIMTEVLIVISMPDGAELLSMQATLTAMDVNTGQVYTSSGFENGAMNLTALRGFYNMTLEGEARCIIDGITQSKRIILKNSDAAIFMDKRCEYVLTVQLL